MVRAKYKSKAEEENHMYSRFRPRAKLPRRSARPSRRRYLNHFVCRGEQQEGQKQASSPSVEPFPFRLAVKDNIATNASSFPTTCASAMLSGYNSPIEATVVTQLRARGAVLVGKTNLDEFAMGSHSVHSAAGPVTSPVTEPTRDGPRSAGGSSGGSAAAVAAGEADVALGTDTGGSVRLPAAYVGIVGFKPSYGMVSRYGVVPYANSLDTVGFLAPRAADVARLVVGGRLFAEHDPRDPTSLSEAARRRCASGREGYDEDGGRVRTSLDGLRFGIPLEYNIEELDSCIRHAWSTAATVVQELGAEAVPVRLPSTRHALSAYYVMAPAEASSNLAKYDGVRYGVGSQQHADEDDVLYATTRGAGFGDEVKRRILLGSYTLSSEAKDNYFVQAQRVRALVRRDFDAVFRLPNPLLDEEHHQFNLSDMADAIELRDKFGPPEVDFLLCPTAPTFPPMLEEVLRQKPLDAYVNDVFTVPASLAGLPAISVPMPVRADTGPLDFAGLQLIGQFWDDARLLSVAVLVGDALASGAQVSGTRIALP